MNNFVYLLDLVDDPKLIEEYEAHHREVWPEVLEHLKRIGLESCEIYRAGNRLVMLTRSETAVNSDQVQSETHLKVLEWEDLMSKYQARLPFAPTGAKWVRADKIFDWKSD